MKVLLTGLLFLGFVFSTQAASIQTFASGNLAPTTLGGYDMTAFAITNDTATGSTTSLPSPLGGVLKFFVGTSTTTPIALNRHLASNPDSDTNTDWWDNAAGNDYDIFTTNEHVVTIVLPEDTQAFYFNVGASIRASTDNAWLTAAESNGPGISKTKFTVGSGVTPGFGVYASDCSSSIKSLVLDPDLWGFGNFSISKGNCTSVPESKSLYLLGFGLVGLLIMGARRRKL